MLLLCKLLEDCLLVLFKDWPRTRDLSCSSFPSSCRAVRPLLAVSGALPEPVHCSSSSATPRLAEPGSFLGEAAVGAQRTLVSETSQQRSAT